MAERMIVKRQRTEGSAFTSARSDEVKTTAFAGQVTAVSGEALLSGGQTVDSETRTYMEPRFGHDFSQVRVHTDDHAAHSAPDSALSMAQGAASPVVTRLGRLAIQRRATPGAATATDVSDVQSRALRAAADVLQYGLSRLIADAGPEYREALDDLYAAKVGVRDGKQVSGSDRLQLLDSAFKKLRPALAAFQSDSENSAWLATEVTPYADQLRESLNIGKAGERLANVSLGPNAKLIEIRTDADPHALATLLHEEIPTLQESIKVIVDNARVSQEQLTRAGEAATARSSDKVTTDGQLAEPGPASTLGEPGAAGTIGEPGTAGKAPSVQLLPKGRNAMTDDQNLMLDPQNLLRLIDGYLILTDDEFAKNLSHITEIGFFRGVETFADFVRAVVQLLGGMVGLAASAAGGLAMARGETELASEAFELAEGATGIVGNIVAGIEIIHGIAVLLDKGSTGEERLEAYRDIASGGAWFAGWAASGSMAVGSALSAATLMLYYEYRLIEEYGVAREGIVGSWMSLAFETLNESGRQIGRDAGELAKSVLLLNDERDPAQRRALESIVKSDAIVLGSAVDDFLEDCKPVGYGPGAAYKPGAFVSLHTQFASLLALMGANTPEKASQAAIAVMEKIGWCFQHARDLLAEELGVPSGGEAKEKRMGK